VYGRRNYVPRRQYRVVYEEVCKTLSELPTLGEVVDVLRQTLIPLQLMFCAGWVHRDISSGNIMAHQDSGAWNAKLGDLEYAKKYPPVNPKDKASVDPKTGTPYFMAVEIMTQIPITRKPAPTTSNTSFFYYPTNNIVAKKVVHNFQHDLESIWWILVWILTKRTGSTNAVCKQFAEDVFNVSMVASHRRVSCITRGKTKWDKVLLPPFQQHFPGVLFNLQTAMCGQYHDRPKIDNLDRTTILNSFSEIHTLFYLAFSALRGAPDSDWRSFPLMGTRSPRGPARKKRARLPDAYSKYDSDEFAPPPSDEEDKEDEEGEELESTTGKPRPKKKKLTTQPGRK